MMNEREVEAADKCMGEIHAQYSNEQLGEIFVGRLDDDMFIKVAMSVHRDRTLQYLKQDHVSHAVWLGFHELRGVEVVGGKVRSGEIISSMTFGN